MAATNDHNLPFVLLFDSFAQVDEALLLQTIVGGQQILTSQLHKGEPIEEFGVYALTTSVG